MRGAQPDWYKHIKAAQYLGTDAISLADPSVPLCWKEWAIAGLTAEAEAQQSLAKDSEPVAE